MKVEQVPGTYRVAFMGLVALGVIGLAALVGLVTGNLFRPGPEPGKDQPVTKNTVGWQKPEPFAFIKEWQNPEAVLVLSGQMQGYLLPCGCSRPQKGGLARRYNFLEMLKAQGWPVLPLDLGDLAQDKAPHNLPSLQGSIKYVTAMKALKLMGYQAIGIGDNELQMPLRVPLDEYALEEKQPRVLIANLLNKTDYPDEVADWILSTPNGGKVKIGVTGFIGPTAAKKLAPEARVKLDSDLQGLKKVLADKTSKDADLRVLLFDGSVQEASAAAAMYPNLFQVILCSDAQDEPPARPAIVGNTMIVTVGHKGKWIGVVGIFPGAKEKYQLRCEMVEMTEDLATPKGKEESHPIRGLMEEYTQLLKRENYLGKYPESKHSLQAALPTTVYAESQTCRGCHAHAYQIWKETPHAHAYQTLVDARKHDPEQPGNREFDPECVVCHVTGFGYKSGFRDMPTTPNLKDVGCEACHGPGMDHVLNPKNKALYPLINPWKAGANETSAEQKDRELKINQFCMSCHDAENDVHWDFVQRWPKIVHHTPPKAPAAPK